MKLIKAIENIDLLRNYLGSKIACKPKEEMYELYLPNDVATDLLAAMEYLTDVAKRLEKTG